MYGGAWYIDSLLRDPRGGWYTPVHTESALHDLSTTTWTTKVRKMRALWAMLRALGRLCYLVSGSRHIINPKV